MVGNKTDLETERKVTFEEGKAFADSLGIKFVECSAKSNTNLDEVFMTLAENIKAKQILLIPEWNYYKIYTNTPWFRTNFLICSFTHDD